MRQSEKSDANRTRSISIGQLKELHSNFYLLLKHLSVDNECNFQILTRKEANYPLTPCKYCLHRIANHLAFRLTHSIPLPFKQITSDKHLICKIRSFEQPSNSRIWSIGYIKSDRVNARDVERRKTGYTWLKCRPSRFIPKRDYLSKDSPHAPSCSH